MFGADIIVRSSNLGLVFVYIGEGGTLMMIDSSGIVTLSEQPVEIDSALIVGNEFQSFSPADDVTFGPFDWGGVVPDRCVAEGNTPPVTCPFGSGS